MEDSSQPVLSANTLAYHGYDFARAFDEIRRIGFQYVEPALISGYYPEITGDFFSPRQARRFAGWIAASGLRVVAVGVHMDLGAADGIAAFLRRLDFASELGASYAHTNSATPSRKKTFLRNLDSLLPEAERRGLVITLENPGDGEDNILASGVAGSALVREIGSAHLRLNYDFSNVYSYSRGAVRPEEDFLHALPATAHFHLKDMVREQDHWRFVAIGRGLTDYGRILSTIRRRPLPMSLELPLRFWRDADFWIRFDPDSEPPGLERIRQALASSRDFVLRGLAGSGSWPPLGPGTEVLR